MQKVGWSMLALVFFLLVSFVPAVIGAFAMTEESRQWYDTLARPDWTPAGWIISLVWTVLYFLMGIAAWLVWRRCEGPEIGIAHAKVALGLFFVQLAVNAAWSPVYFAGQSIVWGLVVLVVLWLLVLATTILFFRHSRPAGVLMLPYIAWVTFAGVLLFQIWRMNT